MPAPPVRGFGLSLMSRARPISGGRKRIGRPRHAHPWTSAPTVVDRGRLRRRLSHLDRANGGSLQSLLMMAWISFLAFRRALMDHVFAATETRR